MTIRVLLADDEELIRVALAALLGLEPDLEVVAQAADGRAAVIGRRTGLSAGTVRNYLAASVQKLGVADRAEAYRLAHRHGWF